MQGNPPGNFRKSEIFIHTYLKLEKDGGRTIFGRSYASFEKSGFVLKSLFDVNPRLEGMSIRGIRVRMMDELVDFLHDNDIEIAALTIPKSKAVEVADILVKNGIKAIWNFAHTDLTLPRDVIVESVHLSDSLMRLSYNISQRENGQK